MTARSVSAWVHGVRSSAEAHVSLGFMATCLPTKSSERPSMASRAPATDNSMSRLLDMPTLLLMDKLYHGPGARAQKGLFYDDVSEGPLDVLYGFYPCDG